ncbi:type VI secretion system contractile sheath small subunit [Massilia sp. CF038]|uniref:type VI secretion system contractile sheath small subunit n=1 Tax=Massilia sp. CF038 TaxID=1881045 RepID=UPI00091EA209|nr:type VI secretion system contractile sheath small subunit [Massilia sp. CF038]SHH10174.1 type VI secretion system protein ImpB [Massilia sp. CF038]
MHTPSKQKWLERNRPPRVQISYDVETAGAIEKKELPLVVGIFADLSGMPETVVPIHERRFVEIDRDNFDQVLAKIGPRLDVARLRMRPVEGVELGGTISFNKIDDFEPEHIVRSIAGLSELFDTRNELRDLMAKLDGNAKLEGRLTALYTDANGTALLKGADAATLDSMLKRDAGAATEAAPPATPEAPPATPEAP